MTMMKQTDSSIALAIGWLISSIAMLLTGLASSSAIADDWNAYALIPSSTPAMVLEAVDSGTTDRNGACRSANQPAHPIRNG